MQRLSHAIGLIKILKENCYIFEEERLWSSYEGKERTEEVIASKLGSPWRDKTKTLHQWKVAFKGLWNQCKKLWNRLKLFSFLNVNGSVWITLRENGLCNIITHIDDLKEIFLDKDFTMFYFSLFLYCWETAIGRLFVK